MTDLGRTPMFQIGFETEFVLLKADKIKDGLPQPACDHSYASQNDMIVHAEGTQFLMTLQ